MASKKQQFPQVTSPRGTFKFPRLTNPDTKFNADGEYGVKLLLEPNGKGVPEFLKRLDDLTDAAVAQMKEENPKFKKSIVRASCYKPEVDNDGEETGKIEVSVSMRAKITAKKGEHAGKVFEKKPALFDGFGKPVVDEKIRIGGGTEGKVTFEAVPYFAANDKRAGISKRLQAAQIITLVEWSSNQDAAKFGFEEEDGGFEAGENTSTTTTTTEDDATEEDAGNADF